MSRIYVTEHRDKVSGIADRGISGLPVVRMPPLASQVLEISVESLVSKPFGPECSIVCVHADSPCSIEFGREPEATRDSRRLAANATEYFQVTAGDRLAVIWNR